MLFDSGHISFLCGHTLPDVSMVACQIHPTTFYFYPFIYHLTRNPLGSLILVFESKISAFICVLVESKYILTAIFREKSILTVWKVFFYVHIKFYIMVNEGEILRTLHWMFSKVPFSSNTLWFWKKTKTLPTLRIPKEWITFKSMAE